MIESAAVDDEEGAPRSVLLALLLLLLLLALLLAPVLLVLAMVISMVSRWKCSNR